MRFASRAYLLSLQSKSSLHGMFNFTYVTSRPTKSKQRHDLCIVWLAVMILCAAVITLYFVVVTLCISARWLCFANRVLRESPAVEH